MFAESLARTGSKGERKEYRRRIRNYLGVSHQPAPDAISTLYAARELGRLLDAATSSRYGIAVFDFRTGDHLLPTDALAMIRARLAADSHVPA